MAHLKCKKVKQQLLANFLLDLLFPVKYQYYSTLVPIMIPELHLGQAVDNFAVTTLISIQI